MRTRHGAVGSMAGISTQSQPPLPFGLPGPKRAKPFDKLWAAGQQSFDDLQVATLLGLRHVALDPSVGLVEAGKPRCGHRDCRQPSQIHNETALLSDAGRGQPVKCEDSERQSTILPRLARRVADRAMNALAAPGDVVPETAST